MPSAPVRVPRCLSAPTPGWTTTADVIVVGSGIAGLTHAMIGLGNGTIGMFASPGTYVMLAAVALGAWLAGRHRERRAA